MKIFVPLVLVATLFSGLCFADALDDSIISKAKRYRLEAIPSSKNKLHDIIEKTLNKKYEMTDDIIELGKKLYHDPRLSKNATISCSSCHDLNNYGVDSKSTSPGVENGENPQHINSPTVYNSTLNQIQFWDGRAKSLETQAVGPLTSSFEMANTEAGVVDAVRNIPAYVEEFKKAFGTDIITFDLISTAISYFERTLVVRTRYDDYLEGDLNALDLNEKEGLKAFLDSGCASCHNGINLGGMMRQFEIYGEYQHRQVGEFKGNDVGLIKAPSLRLVAKTAPYFHNGMVPTLREAVETMTRIQTGMALPKEQVDKILLFFNVLSPELREVEIPHLP